MSAFWLGVTATVAAQLLWRLVRRFAQWEAELYDELYGVGNGDAIRAAASSRAALEKTP